MYRVGVKYLDLSWRLAWWQFSSCKKSVCDENLNWQVIQLNQKAEKQKMSSLGINLAILLRSVVCRGGMEGEEGGGGCDILYKLQGWHIYRLADRLNSQIGRWMEFQRNIWSLVKSLKSDQTINSQYTCKFTLFDRLQKNLNTKN